MLVGVLAGVLVGVVWERERRIQNQLGVRGGCRIAIALNKE